MITVVLTFLIGIAALGIVGFRVCVIARREIFDDLERVRVNQHVAAARMNLRRLHHDARRAMHDAVIDVEDE